MENFTNVNVICNEDNVITATANSLASGHQVLIQRFIGTVEPITDTGSIRCSVLLDVLKKFQASGDRYVVYDIRNVTMVQDELQSNQGIGPGYFRQYRIMYLLGGILKAATNLSDRHLLVEQLKVSVRNTFISDYDKDIIKLAYSLANKRHANNRTKLSTISNEELLSGECIDIKSLGAFLYELCWMKPWRSGDRLGIVANIKEETFQVGDKMKRAITKTERHISLPYTNEFVDFVNLMLLEDAKKRLKIADVKTAIRKFYNEQLLTSLSDPDRMQFLLNQGADPKYSDNDSSGQSVIFYAARISHSVDTIRLLLRSDSALTTITDNAKQTPLHIAAKEGSCLVIEELLDAGAAVDAEDDEKETPLFQAVVKEHEDAVQLLIRCGADLNKRNKHGVTPLGRAASQNCFHVAIILISNGAKLDDVNSIGHAAIHLAARNNQLQMGELLLKYGANPNIQTTGCLSYYSMRQHQITDPRTRPITAKITAGTRIQNYNAVIPPGWTPLMIAAFEGNARFVDLLLTFPQTDIKLVDQQGRDVLKLTDNQNIKNAIAQRFSPFRGGAALLKLTKS